MQESEFIAGRTGEVLALSAAEPTCEAAPMTLERYQELKANLAEAQALELAARLELVARSGHMAKGSKTVVLDGFKVAFTNTVNVSIYEAGIPLVREQLGDEAFDIAFKTKYSYSATGAKSLTAEQQEICEEALVSSNGTPQLKVGAAVK